MELSKQALPIISNKFWIVKQGDTKIGTIQSVDEINGGVVFVQDTKRERFANMRTLAKHHNIKLEDTSDVETSIQFNVHGYPCDTKPFNSMLDLKRNLPMYTKTEKSKSFFCAGYYMVKYSGVWMPEFCPKQITVTRYDTNGPFKTLNEALNER